MSLEQNEEKQPEQQTTKEKNEPVSITSTTPPFNMSLDELKEIISEIVSKEVSEAIKSNCKNRTAFDRFSRFIKRAKFALSFPFVSDKKLRESISEEDPFSLCATLILRGLCLVLYIMVFTALTIGSLILCDRPVPPAFQESSAYLMFFIALLLYTISLVCRVGAVHIDKKQDPSLALSFLALFVSVISSLIPIFHALEPFVTGG